MSTLKYQSIDQLRNIIRQVKDRVHWDGYDEAGEPKFDRNRPMPSIEFHGTVKLHGSNGGIRCNTKTGEITAQSRERDLTIESDNAGFCMYVKQNEAHFRARFNDYLVMLHANDNVIPDFIVLFGEWCGSNIQKGVAICQLPKMFVQFEIHLVTGETRVRSTPVKSLVDHSVGHYDINEFQTFDVTIDFANPEIAQAEIVKIVEAVENECPVGKHFGVSGIGEGVVFTSYNDLGMFQFKAKGEKHSGSKVKTIAAVDVEMFAKVQDFIDQVCDNGRLQQGITWFRENDVKLEKENVGQYIRWVNGDIFKEENDTIIANGLDPKIIANKAGNIARQFYFAVLDKLEQA